MQKEIEPDRRSCAILRVDEIEKFVRLSISHALFCPQLTEGPRGSSVRYKFLVSLNFFSSVPWYYQWKQDCSENFNLIAGYFSYQIS